MQCRTASSSATPRSGRFRSAPSLLRDPARERVEPDLIGALERGLIASAAIDFAHEEPLPVASPLWSAPNLLITPHTAGETQRYEDNVIDLLLDNLERLWRDGGEPVNRII